jgi:hypothetical protein
VPKQEHAVRVGAGSCLAVGHDALRLPDGPFTVEARFRADRFGGRVGLINKTESCEFGIFLSAVKPWFSVHLDGDYREAIADMTLETDRWYHVAGVFDGEEVRLYIDGREVASAPGSGERRLRELPLLIGADVDAGGNAVSPFEGLIDEVRISKTARYDKRFRPARRHRSDADTVLLFHMDGLTGPWLHDASPAAAHADLRGKPKIVPAR